MRGRKLKQEEGSAGKFLFVWKWAFAEARPIVPKATEILGQSGFGILSKFEPRRSSPHGNVLVPDPVTKPAPNAADPAADERNAANAFVAVFIFLLLLGYATDQLQRAWTEGQSIRGQLGLDGRRTLSGRWWTPLTYVFVHFDHLHLALNAAAVGLFGYGLSREWPWRRVAALTLTAGLGGAALWLTVHHGQRGTVIGASAIASGYVAAFALTHPKEGIPIIGTKWSFPRWVLLVPLLALEGRGLLLEAKRQLASQAVSHSAHVGGIVAAALLCLVFRIRTGNRKPGRVP